MNELLKPVDPSWLPILAPVSGELEKIEKFLKETDSLPGVSRAMKALELPAEKVKVLIVGQDPYPTPGHAVGLAFAVAAEVKPLPRSLNNIFKELSNDLGVPAPVDGDLKSWSSQGVLLLNRTLSVEPGKAGSHKNIGWDAVTKRVIEGLSSVNKAYVSILWGAHAQELEGLVAGPVVKSVHPSPLSARRGFFGSKPFSATNTLLEAMNQEPIRWVQPI